MVRWLQGADLARTCDGPVRGAWGGGEDAVDGAGVEARAGKGGGASHERLGELAGVHLRRCRRVPEPLQPRPKLCMKPRP